MTHYCANQRQVLNLNKAEIKKIKIEVHKHGFLREFFFRVFVKKINKRTL